MDLEIMKYNAEKYKIQYNMGYCTRETAKENIMPYINEINKKMKEIAKKHNKKSKLITFCAYIR